MSDDSILCRDKEDAKRAIDQLGGMVVEDWEFLPDGKVRLYINGKLTEMDLKTKRELYKSGIESKLTERDILEGLAEESSELAQSALKLIRAKGLGNSVTPKTESECLSDLLEEITDVLIMIDMLGFDTELFDVDNSEKWERWYRRLNCDE